MKLIKILFILFILQYSNIILSQTTFSKALDILNGNEYGDELEYHGGNYYIAGRGVVLDSITEKPSYPDYIHVLDKDLNQVNTYTMREDFYGVDLYYDMDTVYYFGRIGKVWYIYKFDMKGDSIDIVKIDTFRNSVGKKIGGGRIIPMGDDFYLEGFVEGNSQKGDDLFVMKLSKGGVVKKIERFPEFANPKYYNYGYNTLTKTADGNFAIANLNRTNKNFITGVCKFDKELNLLWYKYFKPTGRRHVDNMAPSLVGTSDSGMVVRSAMYYGDSIIDYKKYRHLAPYPTLMYKLNKYGSTIWTDTIFYNSFHFLFGPHNEGYSMIEARNGDIIQGGFFWYPDTSFNYTGKPEYRAWLCRYSPDGHKKWEHYYLERDYPGYTDIFDIEEADNGDIVCIGGLENKNADIKNQSLTWLLRVDSMGCYPGSDCHPDSMEVLVKIQEVTNPTNIRALELYPNPAKDYIQIKTNEGEKWKKWTIYDFEERKLKSGKIAMTNKETIDISDLRSGIYFLLLKGSKGRYGLGKFVVE